MPRWHFNLLKNIYHDSTQLSVVAILSFTCKTILLSSILTLLNCFPSSANSFIHTLLASGRSLINIRKTVGPKTLPSGIPLVMVLQSDSESREENPQKLTQLSSRSHPRHLVGKRTAQKDTILDIISDSQVNSNFLNRWSPASLTFNDYFYLFLYLYIT